MEGSFLGEGHGLEEEFAGVEVDHLPVSVCHLYLIINNINNGRLTSIMDSNILKALMVINTSITSVENIMSLNTI